MNNPTQKNVEYNNKVVVEKFFYPKTDAIEAIATVVVNGILRINGVRIIKRNTEKVREGYYNNVDDGFQPLCVLMPQIKGSNKKYYGVVRILTDDFALEFEAQVLNQYQAENSKAAH